MSCRGAQSESERTGIIVALSSSRSVLCPPLPSFFPSPSAVTAAVPGATLIHDWPIVVRASIKSANVDAVDASRPRLAVV